MFRKRFFAAAVFALLIAAGHLEARAAKFNKVLDIGDRAPAWKALQGTDDKQHSLSDVEAAKVVVIVFTCNHCPVARMYEQRFIDFAKKYKGKGVEFVAISCSKLPADGFDEMKARAVEKKYKFPYLHDEDQTIGQMYGATRTPQVFVLDRNRKIAYMGGFDDEIIPDKVKHHYVRDAAEALLADKKPDVEESKPRGCPIGYEAQ